MATTTGALTAPVVPKAETIGIKQVVKEFVVDKNPVRVLDGIDLTIAPGEFVSIIGHSGCGKSTLLRIIAGLDGFDGGLVSVGGKGIDGPGTDRGMVFQNHLLLPWLTVRQNLAFGYYEPDARKREDEIERHIKLVGLEGFENAYPRQLSGGMAQRAAIARALLHHPSALLLDEPFGALDAITRMQMQQEVLRIWKQEGTTMVLVTHDIDEAVYLSDRIIVLDGRPARIKEIVNVDLARPRDRSGYDFTAVRKRVYDAFFGDAAQKIEYVI